jgi:hypothetical protein
LNKIANTELKLKDVAPINKGNSRLVFVHPDDPSLIVKVVRPDVIESRFGRGKAWYKRRRRYGQFISYIREIQEYIAFHAAFGRSPHFLQKVFGLAETDIGLGLVTGAERDQEGNLAPNIAMLIERGCFDSAARCDLETFYEQIQSHDIIVSDMNVGNLVYAFSKRHGNHFVLIDGLGNSNILPLKSLSRWINRRSKQKRYERLYKRINTRLDAAGFPMPPMPPR